MSGNFIYRHHVEPRVTLYSPREESFPIPLKYIDVSRTTHTNLDVKQEKRIDDYWNIDGSRNLSDPWTNISQFTLLEEKPPNRYMWSGERLTRKQLTSRPDHSWPEIWKKWEETPSWRKSKSGRMSSSIWKTHENCEGSISLTQKDKEFKETSKNARKKLETSVAPAMPSKIMKKNCGVVAPTKSKQDLRVFWKLVNLQDCVWENHYQIIMKTTLQEKEKFYYNLVHKFIPMPQAMKIPAAKAAVDKEWWKLEKISAWNLTKVRSKKEVIDEARTSSLCIINGHLSLEKMLNWRQNTTSTKGRFVLRGDTVKDDSVSYAVFTEQGSSASQMTAAKIMDVISRLPGCDGQAADAVSAYTQVKIQDAHNCWKFQNRNVQTFGFVCHDTNGLNHGPVWKTQSFLLNAICMVNLWQDYYGKSNLRRSCWSMAGRRFPNWECLFVHRQKGLFLSVYVDDIKIGWKETKPWSDVESTQ